jgi:hypothetical protein
MGYDFFLSRTGSTASLLPGAQLRGITGEEVVIMLRRQLWIGAIAAYTLPAEGH